MSYLNCLPRVIIEFPQCPRPNNDGFRSFNLHQEIATLVQGNSRISAYLSKLKELWDESETLKKPFTDCNYEKT